MSTTYGISYVFVCLVLFTETNALRGALFRTGKRFWSGGGDPNINQFESDKLLKMIDRVDYNNGNQNLMSNLRNVKKVIYLQ
ncbi:hypothetical protein ACH3XW_31020 [Acanthocheilonema viteae]